LRLCGSTGSRMLWLRTRRWKRVASRPPVKPSWAKFDWPGEAKAIS
jgi:hypothetical protein